MFNFFKKRQPQPTLQDLKQAMLDMVEDDELACARDAKGDVRFALTQFKVDLPAPSLTKAEALEYLRGLSDAEWTS